MAGGSGNGSLMFWKPSLFPFSPRFSLVSQGKVLQLNRQTGMGPESFAIRQEFIIVTLSPGMAAFVGEKWQVVGAGNCCLGDIVPVRALRPCHDPEIGPNIHLFGPLSPRQAGVPLAHSLWREQMASAGPAALHPRCPRSLGAS